MKHKNLKVRRICGAVSIQKELAKILSPKAIPVDYNSLDVADLWIEKLLDHFGDRVEYIHYKTL